MDVRRRWTHDHRGQASPEYLGIVVIVVILLVGAIWVMRGRVSGHSPLSPGPPVAAAVERATVPLDRLSRPDARPGRWERFAGTVRRAGRIIGIGGAAFGRGFARALVRDLVAVVRDPTGVLRGGEGLIDALRHPIRSARGLARDLRAYVRELRAMDREAAYRRIMGDLGGVTEDLLATRGRAFVLKRLARAARDRARHSERGSGDSSPQP